MDLLLNDEVGQQRLLDELSQGGGGGEIADGSVTTAKIAEKAVTAEKLSDEVNAAIAAGGASTFGFTMYGDPDAAESYEVSRAYSTDEVTFAELQEAWEAGAKIIVTLWWDKEFGQPTDEVTVIAHHLAAGGTEMFRVVYPKGNEIAYGGIENLGTKILLAIYTLSAS